MGFNWFDLVFLIVLGFGLFRGKRNGMSKELIPLVQWLVMVPVCALFYPKVGGLMASFLADKMWNGIVAYLALAFVVFIVFKIIKESFAEKLVKSDFFKDAEYYLGMFAALLRYACVMIFVLALLNAPVYTSADISAQMASDQKNFGGGAGSSFSGSYFPHLFQIQAAVFKDSFIGPRIKNYAGVLLINTGKSGKNKNTPEAPKTQPVIKIGN
jgi:uncharacterized membrane protein required for colicin V production